MMSLFLNIVQPPFQNRKMAFDHTCLDIGTNLDFQLNNKKSYSIHYYELCVIYSVNVLWHSTDCGIFCFHFIACVGFALSCQTISCMDFKKL